MTRPLIATLLLLLPALANAAEPPRPVRVFLLAGQSKMEGKAKVSLLEYQAQQPATRDLFRHLRQGDRWAERDDVWIKYRDYHGKLVVGFGTPPCIGPELEFGNVVGDHYPEQVLLIKTAWGGRSLYRDFRPPSAGLPAPAVLDRLLAALKKRQPDATLDDLKSTFGASYRDMLAEVNETLGNLKKYFPAYAGQGHELAGFVWFQGWNDMIDAEATAEYAANLAHFIRDVRQDLKAPGLPFVIGQMGVDGASPGPGVQRFQEAQAAAAALPEFRGNVALVKTDRFWDAEADAVFKKGWRQHLEEWNKVGSDYPYHYLGSPKTMCAIGRAFGEAVLDLRGEKRTHGFLATGGQTYITDGQGKLLWQYPHGSRDGWALPGGNVLLALSKSKQYPGGAAVEVTRQGKVVFEYRGTQSEVNTVQPLGEGRVLLTEAGARPRLLEVDRQGKVLVEVPLQAQTRDHHLQTRMARKLPGGNYLVPQLLDRVVREYTPEGKVVWEAKTPHMPFTAIRLPDGNTLIGCTLGNLVVEVDAKGQVVWQVGNDDLPGRPINDACGVQRLPNGNTVITSHHARGDEVKLTEVTRDRRIVWTYRDGARPGIHHFQILDTNGQALEGPPLR